MQSGQWGQVILNQVQQKSLAQDIARPIANYYAGSGVIGQALASPMTIGGAAGGNNVINVPVTINNEGGVSGGNLNAADGAV